MFCVVGFFIPGFTAFFILGLQMGVELLGVQCPTSWTVVWALTTVGMIIAPFIFIRIIYKKTSDGYHLSEDKLIIFNVLEYTFIQATLAAFFTSGRVLCYVTDGQNGIEFAFTGWIALPFLVILSLIFDNLREQKIAQQVKMGAGNIAKTEKKAID
jgi:hypothetical protein